ncbi:thiol-disulfide oxidoreductase DCC family protein [Acidiphilium sp.]|uniref:thiol-disulfide oxidoreductase DCC family protein n=1 Tax=Acidiphilium sp. TaxID=527 RepID=UPI003D041B31
MADDTTTLTVYYDGACPVCSREIAFYRDQMERDQAGRINWVDATICGADALGPGLDRMQALARMHVRTADGELVSGAAAFGRIWRELPRFRPLGTVLAIGPVAVIAEWAYRGFLRLRRRWRPG